MVGEILKEFVEELKSKIESIPEEEKRIKSEYKKEFQGKHLALLKKEALKLHSKINELHNLKTEMPLVLANGLCDHFSKNKIYFSEEHSKQFRGLLERYPLEIVLDLARTRIEGENEPELRPEFIQKIEEIKKQKSIKVNNFAERYRI